MPTVKLTPSTYYLSNSSYLRVTNEDNMYDDCDSTNYATVTNSRTSTSSYYIYVRGFDFSQIPSNAVVTDFTIRLKGNYSGGYSQNMYLYDGTSTKMGSASSLSTSVNTREFTCSHSWEDLVAAGSDFGIRINCRRSSRNTTSYIYIYGAEIEVAYTIPNPRTITTSLNGNGTIDPSGTNTFYDGDEVTLTIVPTNSSDTVSAKRDGVDITLTEESGSGTESAVLGEYTLVSGSFNGSGASYFEGIVGNGVDASKTTSNYYSGGSSVRAIFTYAFDFSAIPANATITRVYCEVNGHAESTSNSSEYMCVQLMSGNTEITEEINYKSIGTSNTTVTLEAEGTVTREDLENLVLQCTLGYYGGAINGATCYVEYTLTSKTYTYTWVVDSDTTIVVTIGSASSDVLWVKPGSTWIQTIRAWKKINNTWVVQSDVTTVFQSGVHYKRGN